MFDTLFFILFSIFAVIGLMGVMQEILLFMSTPKNNGKYYIIVPLKEGQEDAEILLRGAEIRSRSVGFLYHTQVIAVDMGMDQETKQIFNALCKEYPNMTLCRLDELGEKVE